VLIGVLFLAMIQSIYLVLILEPYPYPFHLDLKNFLPPHTSIPILAIQTLLSLAIFNFLIGNCDTHGKNISFLYPIQGKPRNRTATLAPLYDLVSTTVYEDLSSKLSMKIGGEYRIDHIRRNHFILFGEEVHVGRPYMEKLLDSMSTAVSRALERIALLSGILMKEPLITTMKEQVEKRVRQIEV
jgi:hypothetical protein